MKTKHTPGPWFVREIKVMHGVAHDVSSADFPIVKDVQRIADARLIAAAPELLAVAKNTAGLLEAIMPIFSVLDGTAETDYAPKFTQIVQTIKLVIAKAEGEE